jgi:GNAT superfamily N-acetyltransferase
MAIGSIDATSDTAKEAAVSALTLAFVRDPIMRWFYPEPAQYLSHFPGFCHAFGGRAFECGAAWASDDSGGAALWLRPGIEPDGDAIEKHLMTTVEESKLETLGSTLEQMDKIHPDEPHWYLAIIGVDAAHQGKGTGAKLLQIALAECDEAGTIAYLESSNPANVSLYERHGFEVAGEIRAGDAPPATPMIRPAR